MGCMHGEGAKLYARFGIGTWIWIGIGIGALCLAARLRTLIVMLIGNGSIA